VSVELSAAEAVMVTLLPDFAAEYVDAVHALPLIVVVTPGGMASLLELVLSLLQLERATIKTNTVE
jgi:hypothetical protein